MARKRLAGRVRSRRQSLANMEHHEVPSQFASDVGLPPRFNGASVGRIWANGPAQFVTARREFDHDLWLDVYAYDSEGNRIGQHDAEKNITLSKISVDK